MLRFCAAPPRGRPVRPTKSTSTSTRQLEPLVCQKIRTLPAAVDRVPVLFTEFDPYDLRNLEGFLHQRVLPSVAGPKAAVLARGDNPFTSLCTRQVPCSVNEVTQNNGQWLLFGSISAPAAAGGAWGGAPRLPRARAELRISAPAR